MQAVFTLHIVPFFARAYPARAAALRVAVDMYEPVLAPFFAQVRERYPSTNPKGYIALGGLNSPLGLPLDIIARSTAEAPAETILQQAVAYLSELVATKGRTLRNL